jgi:hypothetical protein
MAPQKSNTISNTIVKLINQCSIFMCTNNLLSWGLLRFNKTTLYISHINVLTVNEFSRSLGCWHLFSSLRWPKINMTGPHQKKQLLKPSKDWTINLSDSMGTDWQLRPLNHAWVTSYRDIFNQEKFCLLQLAPENWQSNSTTRLHTFSIDDLINIFCWTCWHLFSHLQKL